MKIGDFEHIPRKRFGQNFLKDENLLLKMIRAIDPQPGDQFVEIGSGTGALTEHLLSSVASLEAIEIDRDLVEYLKEKFGPEPHFRVHSADALSFDYQSLVQTSLSLPSKKLRLAGNLPYNISTPLLFHLVSFSEIFSDMHFMLQKEVVDRMTAEPRSKEYGRLSVRMQYHFKVSSLFKVPPEAFHPKPKVVSAVVRLVPYETPLDPVLNMQCFEEVLRLSFNQRRKMLSNTLKPYFKDEDFEALGLKGSARPEELFVKDFVGLCNFLIRNNRWPHTR